MKNLIERIKNAIRVLGFMGILKLYLVNIKISFLKKSKENSYSQLFEDYFLDKFLKFKKKGFYVDIGANNPSVLNNTKRFYLKKWQGINIEPNAKLFQLFLKERSKDINLNIGVGIKKDILNFYDFDLDGLSTFSKEEVEKRKSMGNKVKNIVKIKVDRLENILYENLPKNTDIDFMSVDTEGFDLIVLKSNNWFLFRPKFICVEVIECGSIKVSKNSLVDKFLKSVNYREVFFNGINSIYVDNEKVN